jgi:hypothetical protein
MYDKFEAIAGYAAHPVCILGNLQTSDFELVDVSESAPLSEEAENEIRRRGLHFIGALGIVKGKPRTALDEPLDEATIFAISAAYFQYVTEANRKPKGDSAAFLARLFQLPDERGGGDA